MAQATYTPIQLYFSTTAAAIPIAGNLANGELGLNISDMKLYTKNSAGVVTLLASSAGASGTVTSVAQSFTGGIVSVAGSPITTSGTLALTVAGTSGGVPYFSSASTWASSAALTQYGVVYGGGAGAAPVATAVGTATHVLTSNGPGVAPTFQAPASGGAALSNDTTTATDLFPMFAAATTGTPTTVFTSNAKLLYKPSTGEFQASELVASNGIFVNNTTVSVSYTVATGFNAMSVGPITVASGQSVTVTSGQRWVVI